MEYRSKVSPNGRTAIPHEVREHFGLEPRNRLFHGTGAGAASAIPICVWSRFASVRGLFETAELLFEERHFLSALINHADTPGDEIADHAMTLCGARARMIIVAFDCRPAKSNASMELFA